MEPVQMTPEQARKMLDQMNELIGKMEKEAVTLRAQYKQLKACIESQLNEE